jgi:uncharacterized protein (TIGR03086 family)
VQATELDRALDSTLAILVRVRPGQLEAPTPCASWSVRALVSHFIGTTRWWAGLVTGEEGGGPGPDYAAGDFVAAYEEGIQIATTAFRADGVPGATVRLPFGEFPGAVVLGMAAIEQFTHGWDLARAIGYQGGLDPELASELLGQATSVITDAYRGADGQALFGPAAKAPSGAGPADQLAAFLGRRV